MANPAPLQPGKYYHIYNRGNNRENLFREERNYRYFLALYAQHVGPFADTYAYCLLMNHFHLLVRIKDLGAVSGASFDPSRLFSNLFNAYARAFNKTYGRTGALFQRPFGRIEITDDAYFVRVAVYIHRNPQKHGFVTDFREWSYSSYQAMLSSRPTHIRRADVLEWFGDVAQFTQAHCLDSADHELMPLLSEDFT
jgi:REP element-mobilizing transposase RayT